jgi:hypothetical protein
VDPLQVPGPRATVDRGRGGLNMAEATVALAAPATGALPPGATGSRPPAVTAALAAPVTGALPPAGTAALAALATAALPPAAKASLPESGGDGAKAREWRRRADAMGAPRFCPGERAGRPGRRGRGRAGGRNSQSLALDKYS